MMHIEDTEDKRKLNQSSSSEDNTDETESEEGSSGDGNYFDESESDGDDDDQMEWAEAEDDSQMDIEQPELQRMESKNLVSDYAYELIDPKKLKSLFFSKILEIKSDFDYANLHDSAFHKVFRDNKYVTKTTIKALNDRILDYMNKFAMKSPEEIDSFLSSPEGQNCSVCWMEFNNKANKPLHLGCGHVYCQECFTGYVEEKISEGPTCISAPCPSSHTHCEHQITPEFVESCCPPKKANKFLKFVLDDFVSQAPYISYCPSPDCQTAIYAQETNLTSKNELPQMSAICNCGTPICMRCKGLAHEPLTCEDYASWEDSIDKIYDKLNYKWKKENTKNCPKCNAHIEKNQGCNFMRCSKCKHEFCWFCLKDWKDHDQKHVWKNTCNTYKAKKSVEEMNEEEKLKRMEFFMDRYRAHKRSYELNDDRIKAHLKVISEPKKQFYKLNTEVSQS